MATVFDNTPVYTPAPVQEDEALHNALIKERYRQLQNAEASQLAGSISEAGKASYESPRISASVLTPERPERTVSYPSAPAAPSAPEREEFEPYEMGHTRVDSPLFTPEMLEKTLRYSYYDYDSEEEEEELEAPSASAMAAQTTPVEMAMPIGTAMPVEAEAPAEIAAVAPREESYGLNAFAIKMIAAFAAVVVLLFTVIGINSSVIRGKTVRLNELEQRKESLTEEYSRIKQQADDAHSFESIINYGEENGYIRISPQD